jgi:phage gp16-like protein
MFVFVFEASIKTSQRNVGYSQFNKARRRFVETGFQREKNDNEALNESMIPNKIHPNH